MKNVVLRGLKGRCPNCGRGQLFKGYITQVELCSVCHEDYSDIRADDAPPWLTILITAHIVVPLLLEFARYDAFPESVEIGIVIAVAVVCVFLILPRVKGAFLAEIWRQSKLKDIESSSD